VGVRSCNVAKQDRRAEQHRLATDAATARKHQVVLQLLAGRQTTTNWTADLPQRPRHRLFTADLQAALIRSNAVLFMDADLEDIADTPPTALFLCTAPRFYFDLRLELSTDAFSGAELMQADPLDQFALLAQVHSISNSSAFGGTWTATGHLIGFSKLPKP